MRTAALAHFVILALALSGPAWAQDRAQDQPAPVIEPAAPPSSPRILSVPAEQAAPVAQQPPAPAPAPKVQDRADTKGDLLPPPPVAESRFSFKRVHGGFVRLDGQSGQVAHCAPRDNGWTCRTVPEGSAPIEAEISGLRNEVAALKDKIAEVNEQVAALTKEIQALRAPPPPPPVPPASAPSPPEQTFKVPTREDLAWAGDYVRDKARATWHRLVNMIGDAQKNMLGES